MPFLESMLYVKSLWNSKKLWVQLNRVIYQLLSELVTLPQRAQMALNRPQASSPLRLLATSQRQSTS